MAIKSLTPKKHIEQYTIQQLRRIELSIINTLSYIGEQCVNEARANGGYLDQTGNLRSSIGYVVLHNGRVVVPMRFEQVKQGGKGVKEGEQFINQLIGQYTKGFALIIVAGMDYAAHVEAGGLNVLASSELKASKITPQLLKKLGIK
jgi:hypothetical protein